MKTETRPRMWINQMLTALHDDVAAFEKWYLERNRAMPSIHPLYLTELEWRDEFETFMELDRRENKTAKEQEELDFPVEKKENT